MTNAPKALRRDCKKAVAWKNYYERMAADLQKSVDVLKKDYPNAAEMILRDAERFREGIDEIVNKTHPNILSGKWK